MGSRNHIIALSTRKPPFVLSPQAPTSNLSADVSESEQYDIVKPIDFHTSAMEFINPDL
jgi:hypothetical protein